MDIAITEYADINRKDILKKLAEYIYSLEMESEVWRRKEVLEMTIWAGENDTVARTKAAYEIANLLDIPEDELDEMVNTFRDRDIAHQKRMEEF